MRLNCFWRKILSLLDAALVFYHISKIIDVYNSTSAYISDAWKATAVDEVAAVISANSEQKVYAYRWDWDEGATTWLVRLFNSDWCGSRHGSDFCV